MSDVYFVQKFAAVALGPGDTLRLEVTIADDDCKWDIKNIGTGTATLTSVGIGPASPAPHPLSHDERVELAADLVEIARDLA